MRVGTGLVLPVPHLRIYHLNCDLIEGDCIAHTERDNCSRPIKSRTDEERDLVAVVEVARDRRVDPDRTCCRVDDAAVHDKLVGFVHAAWSCACCCDVECPCSCPLRDIHERPEEVAFCAAAAPRRRHLRQVACEVLDLRMPSVVVAGTMSTTDVWFAATDATDAFCWIEYLSRFP